MCVFSAFLWVDICFEKFPRNNLLMSWEVGSALGGDLRGVDLWSHHGSDGEHSCIFSILVVALPVAVLVGCIANVWMYQLLKTFRCLPGMPLGPPSECDCVNECPSFRLIGFLGVRQHFILSKERT